MVRFSWVVPVAVVLSSLAQGQGRLPPDSVVPIDPALVKHAGTVDVRTGRWTANGKDIVPWCVFDNTCLGPSLPGYFELQPCEDLYDEGQVPAPDNTVWQAQSIALGGSGTGTYDNYVINGLELAYCTHNATVTLEVAFWHNLGGGCVGYAPPTSAGTHWSSYNGHTGGGMGTAGYFDLAGLGLPGGTSAGGLACWVVALSNFGFDLDADGDGTFDNDPTVDKFNWAARLNDVPPAGSPTANGLIIAGDPLGSGVYGAGSCTFDIPCETGGWAGTPCGNGYGSEDHWWINSDGGVAGGCSPAAHASACYWFGGYPQSPFASAWIRLEASPPMCGPCGLCPSRPTSVPGCLPLLTGPFLITKGAGGTVLAPAGPTPGGGGGLLIFGSTLASPSIPVNYGLLCLNPPFARAGSTFMSPGGTYPNCDGQFLWNLQALVDNALPGQADVGMVIYIQGWYRDPPNPFGANLTNAWGGIMIQ